MNSKGIENDFDDIFFTKKRIEGSSKALHIELQNAILLCSKMEEVRVILFTRSTSHSAQHLFATM